MNTTKDKKMSGQMVEIPEKLFNLNMSPYAFRLYFHIKSVAITNDGICRRSNQQMAKHCRMSTGKIFLTKQELERAGLITVVHGKKGEVDTIRVSDTI